MKVKYNRVSTLQQSGDRFTADTDSYDLVLMDKVSGSVGFKDRPKGRELIKLVEEGKVTDLIIEEFSRLGRNTGDCIRTLEWLEEKNINVIVRNLGIQSRPNGKKNPVWKMMSAVMSSMHELELENIKERTTVGRQVYVQKGGVLGRPKGSNQSETEFLKKDKSSAVLKSLKKGLTVREASKVAGVSTRSVMKVKRLGIKHGIL
ncbi:MAG: recombinase family protein [Bacteroidales bacterium]|nr:recombinase family protein [Bacteroidales bacterium]